MKRILLILAILPLAFLACNEPAEMPEEGTVEDTTAHEDFEYKTEQFADLKILRYRIPGFEDLSLDQKKLLYYLYEAAYSGRDMIYDQNNKHNLAVRRTLEAIVNGYQGDKETEDWKNFMTYTKQVWWSNGVHHTYASIKHVPAFSQEYFKELALGVSDALPVSEGQSAEELVDALTPIIFDPSIDAKKTNKAEGVDVVVASANNFYEGVTQAEVIDFYKKLKDPNDNEPISYGLNSKLIKEDGVIKEKVWKIGGMYSEALEKVAFWLDKAAGVAENDMQREVIEKLIRYYNSGDLEHFDDYCIAWVEDTISDMYFINGFTEVYTDPMSYRGTWESVVSMKDPEASKRIEAIGAEAQWFEDNSTIMDEHKKNPVKGIDARVISVVAESGDASPSTPIGINLPNSNWIRAKHGSKSVNLANIVTAYDLSSKGSGALEEFTWDEEEARIAREYGELADNLHTDMHEVIGHASGVINEGVGTPKETLGGYSSALEEGRADLVALYFLMDEKLIELGVMPSLDCGRTQYDSYISNGMMLQLKRIKPGEQIEEDHMRNRQMVAQWCYEKGKEENVIERKERDGKTFFVVNDYEKLRGLFGELLREIQRIKSEGDFAAGKALIEDYGVKVDPDLHAEVLERYEALNIAPYSGFINPVLIPVMEDDEIVDVQVVYPDSFTDQMLYYAREYSFLPTYN